MLQVAILLLKVDYQDSKFSMQLGHAEFQMPDDLGTSATMTQHVQMSLASLV